MPHKYETAEDGLRQFPKKRYIPDKIYKTFIMFPFELELKKKEPLEVKVRESIDLIKEHLKVFKYPYVATSHGMDSIVMCDLVVRAVKELQEEGFDVKMPAFFLNNTLNLFPEEKDYWIKINKYFGIEVQFKEFMPPKDENDKYMTVWTIAEKAGHLPFFRSTAKHIAKSYKNTATPECCKYLKKESVNRFLKKLKKDPKRYDLAIIGTLAEESHVRWQIALQQCRSFLKKYRVPYRIRTLTPLTWWKKTDVYIYIEERGIPKPPSYEIHNLKRMGCASCPAYVGWEKDQLKDPTGFRFNFLKMNLAFMEKHEPERLEISLEIINKYLKNKKSRTEITEEIRVKTLKLLSKYGYAKPLEVF